MSRSQLHSSNLDNSATTLRRRFDRFYEQNIVGVGFCETDDYYRKEKGRYWRSLQLLLEVAPPPPATMLEIGGGQLAILCNKLLGYECTVADVSHTYAEPIERQGLKFHKYNLVTDTGNNTYQRFDVVALLEVIEHVPLPAYVILEKIKALLTDGGIVFITTPNLFRIRNLIRMLFGVEFLDRFELPTGDVSLGHQLEYSADHLLWQIRRANMDVVMLRHDNLGHVGHSIKAQMGRLLAAPLGLRPKWRDGLVAVARKVS